MSDKDGKQDDDYVGYGRPPKSNRFVKGQSGNPGGRPRSPKRISAEAFGGSDFEKMVEEELERVVLVREGDSTERTAVMRASTRAMSVKSAKGDVKAYKTLADIQQRIDRRKQSEWDKLVSTALNYAEEASTALNNRRRWGIKGPEIVPHPDDICINFTERLVYLSGPYTMKQKMAQDFFVSAWPAIERDLVDSPDYKRRDREFMRIYLKLKKGAAMVYDLIAKRASKVNSWEIASPRVRLDYLREVEWPEFSKDFPPQLAHSENFFRGVFREYVPYEPNEEEKKAVIAEIKRAVGFEAR